MAKRPNAANITHGLAQLGGGSKKDGGSGMMGGMQFIFKTGIQLGNQLGLEGKDVSEKLDELSRKYIEKK
ncbi:hypothetical protein SAMN04487928_106130 [Butyrivibrio proteoclasticus]|uniref:Uncharacterized protein n=1 Tax=Butyrivibrio proteoclasticus TaxID=43305 RepID=A0A1I5SKW5_9FIRM|nr:hypothetical protein [Butyrivibrio proteoclasticus]SFP71444.1 hypothetical protein SAMN04487928_106130 [Butyrivibrio proteoclasticus]